MVGELTKSLEKIGLDMHVAALVSSTFLTSRPTSIIDNNLWQPAL